MLYFGIFFLSISSMILQSSYSLNSYFRIHFTQFTYNALKLLLKISEAHRLYIWKLYDSFFFFFFFCLSLFFSFLIQIFKWHLQNKKEPVNAANDEVKTFVQIYPEGRSTKQIQNCDNPQCFHEECPFIVTIFLTDTISRSYFLFIQTVTFAPFQSFFYIYFIFFIHERRQPTFFPNLFVKEA